MNAVSAKRTVVLTMVGTGVVLIISRIVKEHSFPIDPRMYIALAFIYVTLGFVAEFAPEVAGPFAVLVFVSVLLFQGQPVFSGITDTLNEKGRRKKRK